MDMHALLIPTACLLVAILIGVLFFPKTIIYIDTSASMSVKALRVWDWLRCMRFVFVTVITFNHKGLVTLGGRKKSQRKLHRSMFDGPSDYGDAVRDFELSGATRAIILTDEELPIDDPRITVIVF